MLVVEMMLQYTCKNPLIRSVRHQCLRWSRHVQTSSTQLLSQTPIHNEIFDINNEDDFRDKVMRSSIPVIVNFHADWCEPCHDIKPLLQKIVKENNGKVNLAEISVEEHASLIQVFEVTAVPAILAIHRGSVKDKFIGLVSEEQIKAFVTKLLAESS